MDDPPSPSPEPTSPAAGVLSARLLGPVRVTWGADTDAPAPLAVASQRTLWVLVALLVSPKPLLRQRLAGWLWSERTDSVARTNLRVAVHGLRAALGDRIGGDRQHLWWAPQPADTVDLHRLRARLQAGGDALDGLALPGPLCADLGEADAEGAEGFAVWLADQRTQLQAAVVQAHLGRATALADGDALASAEQHVRAVLALQPDHAAAHALLVRILSATGQRAALDLHRQALHAVDTPHSLVRQAREVLGRVPAPRLGHVPATADRFVGRAAEQATLRALLAAGRLVTLTGLGGMGKTRLALSLAQAWEARDGVWFVDLSGAHRDEVAAAVLHALGLLSATRQPAEATLLAALADRDMLLVLDNAEVAEDEVAALVAALLARAPAVRVLVTARRPLRLRAEQVLALGGLPRDGDRHPLGDAGELFVARDPAAAHDPGLPALLVVLDGMPLAIELAAALRRRLGDAAAVLARLQAATLQAEERDRPDRHRSLEDALAGTWALLSPDARALLAALSTFLGTFTAARVAPTPPQQAALDELREAATLAVLPGGRLRLHQAARAFAAARQADPAALRQWHREIIRGDVGVAVAHLYTRQHAAATDLLRARRDDLFAAWDRAAAAQEAEALETLLLPLWDAADAMGWYQEAEARFRRAQAHLDAALLRWGQAWMLGRLGRAAEGLEQTAGCPLDHQEARRTRAVLCVQAGQLEEARQITAALLLEPEHQDAQLWNVCGVVSLRQGDTAQARRCFEAGRAAAQAQGLEGRIPALLHGLAAVARFEGHLETAQRLHKEALILRRSMPDPRGLALTLTSLAACEAELGNLEASRRHLLEARRLAWDVGDPPGRALAEHNLGCLELLEDPLEAEGRLSAAISLRRQQRDGVGLAYSLAARAEARARCGQPEAAHADLREARLLAAQYPDARLDRQLDRHAAQVAAAAPPPPL